MSAFTELTETQVRAIAQRHIEANQAPDYEIVITGIHASESLQEWVVFVKSEPEDVSGMDFARRLADIEEKIQGEAGDVIILHVSLQWQDESGG
ncbi:MAG: hypothetical protein WD009_13520 [Phycisphaeraceae bacterium]